MRLLFLTALTATAPAALMLTASPASADTLINAYQMRPDADDGIGQTEIVVAGNTQEYTRVKSETVSAWVAMSGHPPKRARNHSGSTMRIGSYTLEFDEPREWRPYKAVFKYTPPRNGTFDPVLYCNNKLKGLSGNARNQFLRNGRPYILRNAYEGQLQSSWIVNAKKKRGLFQDPPTLQTWENTLQIDSQIICGPLDKNAGATRTNPEPVPQRSNPDPSTLPRLKTATLAISPYANVQRGAYSCPTKLRLRGFIETRRKMRGKLIFVGPQFLSPVKDFNFRRAGTMNHVANYTLKWGGGGSDTLALSTGSAPRQNLSFKFNVVNGRGDLVKTVERDIRVTCK